MQNKHTPAPWKVIKEVERLPNSKEIQTLDGKVIAEVFTDVAESAANARLIAAAPELLAALKNLLDDVEYARQYIEPGLIGARQVRAARAALALLEGDN